MESISSKEFFEKLKNNSLKPSFSLKGIVKKSEKDSEVLFTRKGDFIHWTKIPSSMIESVSVIKTFSKGEETFVVAKLRLKTPATPEEKVLYELVSSSEHEDKFDWKSKLMHGLHGMGERFMAGHKHCCPHCGCPQDQHSDFKSSSN